MASKTPSSVSGKSRMSTEVLCALIAVGGTTVGAVVTNWDKITHSTVTAKYDGYQSTNDFESEMRIYFEKTGLRRQIGDMQEKMLDGLQSSMPNTSSEDKERSRKIFDWIKKNSPTVDETLKDMIPIFKKYMTLDQIQELNKFYSTPQMRDMVAVQPKITEEIIPIALKNMQQMQQKMMVAAQNGEFDVTKDTRNLDGAGANAP